MVHSPTWSPLEKVVVCGNKSFGNMLPHGCGELAAHSRLVAARPTCCGSRLPAVCVPQKVPTTDDRHCVSAPRRLRGTRHAAQRVRSVSALFSCLFLAYFLRVLRRVLRLRVASASGSVAKRESFPLISKVGRIRGDPWHSLTIGTFYRYLRQLLSALAPLATDAVLQLNGSYAGQELHGGSSGSGSGSGLSAEEVSISGADAGDLLYNYNYNYTGTGLELALAADLGLAAPTAATAPALLPAAASNHSQRSGVARVSADVPIWVIPCYSIILLCAVVGNLLVVLTLVQNRRMRTITNVFLLNLAISDILLGVFCMPVTLVGTLLRHFIFGEFLCKLIQFAQAASVAVSSWTLVAISCERYYAICHPLRSRTWQTINHANKIIAIIWLGSLLCMTPIALFSQLMPTSRPGLRKCREQWPADSLNYERAYNLFLDLALLVLPLLALSFTYLFITRTLYVSMRNERAMNFGSSGPEVPPGPPLPSSSQRRSNGSHSHSLETGMQQQQPQPQQQQQFGTPQYYYADSYTHGGSKRKLLGGSCEGRRHLYCMRSASVKSLRQQQHNQPQPQPPPINGNDCCSRAQRLRHHQQQQHICMGMGNDNESRRKSLSQPSLRITEAGLRSIVPRRSNESKSLESKKRVVKMLFVLVLEFFICWTPLYVINTMTMLIGPVVYEYVDYTAISFLQLLAYSSSCCNPITYCFMNASFRRAFVDTFKVRLCGEGGGRLCFWRRRSKNETNLSVAGNSIALANSVMSTHTILESPRL